MNKKAKSNSTVVHMIKDETLNNDLNLCCRKGRNMRIYMPGKQLKNQANQQRKDHNGHTHNSCDVSGTPAILAPKMLHYLGYANPARFESMATRPNDRTSQPTGTAHKESSSHGKL